MEKKIVAAVLLLVFLCPSVLLGSGFFCDVGNLQGPVHKNRKNIEEGKGNINMGGISVLVGILAMGQSLRDGLNRQSATINSNVEAQTAVIHSTLESVAIQRKKAETDRVFGARTSSYNSFADDFSSGVHSGLQGRQMVSEKLRESLADHSRAYDSRADIQRRLSEAPYQGDIFGRKTKNSRQIFDAMETSKTTLDPIPALNVSGSYDEGVLSKEYEFMRRAKDAKLLIPNTIMSDLIADRSPVMEVDEWLAGLEERFAYKVETVDEKVSMDDFLEAISFMRFANHDWLAGQDGIHGKHDAGMLREIIQAEVDGLMVEYEQLRWMDRMTAAMVQMQIEGNDLLDKVILDTQGSAIR